MTDWFLKFLKIDRYIDYIVSNVSVIANDKLERMMEVVVVNCNLLPKHLYGGTGMSSLRAQNRTPDFQYEGKELITRHMFDLLKLHRIE